MIALLGVPLLFFGLKDDPAEVGLAQAVKNDEAKSDEPDPLEKMDSSKYKKIMGKMVFGNPFIWIIAVSNFCVYVIRLTILDWGASFLTEEKGMDMEAHYSIPAFMNERISQGTRVKVVETPAKWMGLVSHDDKIQVLLRINEMMRKGVYPRRLFERINE